MENYYYKKYKKKKFLSILMLLVLIVLFFLFALFVSNTIKQFLVIFIFPVIVFGIAFYFLIFVSLMRWKKVLFTPFPDNWRQILKENVVFYKELVDDEKEYFEKRIQYFLETKKITGVETEVDDKLRVLIAASAIIPVFAFPDFEYDNIDEILVYPDSFDEEYNTGNDKKILGMVGDGAMNRMMILSKPDILNAFSGKRTVHNVALHEFVHLIDKKDGSIDGIPKILINKAFVLPWLRELKKEERRIKKHKSDISPYALTNDSEFLAVASEYFFMSPQRFRKKHSELYKYFSKIYRKPVFYLKNTLTE